MNKHYGGTVVRKKIREDGQFTVTMETSCTLFTGLSPSQEVLLTHGDSIEQVADCLKVTATSGELVAALAHREESVFGVQFHPEVELTENGQTILQNFLYKVCTLSLISNTSTFCVCTRHIIYVHSSSFNRYLVAMETILF